MHIHGLQKLAMVDYPGKLAATVFTGGCNLRCPFCHNALLVTRLAETPEIPEQEVLDFLASRRGLLDGVVLTGGEPLLFPDFKTLYRRLRNLGMILTINTNASCFSAPCPRRTGRPLTAAPARRSLWRSRSRPACWRNQTGP